MTQHHKQHLGTGLMDRGKSVVTTAGRAGIALAMGGAALLGGATPASAVTPVVIATIAPFTGADAVEGPGTLNDCQAAASVIARSGGILGRNVSCVSADTRSDPADAIPAARKLLAGHSDISLVLGLGSDEAAAVVPLLNAEKIVMNSFSGQSEWNKNAYPYFFRPSPPDIEEATALVALAKQSGHHRIALVFGNDLGGQAFIAPAEHAIQKAGMKLAINQTLDLTGTTFRTEVAKVMQAHPDLIITEVAGAAGNAFLSEYKQQAGGKLPAIELTQNAVSSPTWFKDLSGAIGTTTVVAKVTADSLYVDPNAPGHTVYDSAIKAVVGNDPGTLQFFETNPNGLDPYDAVMQAALAMDQAKSTVPAVYLPMVKQVTNGVPGATVVHTYSNGLASIRAGKKIHYVGVGIAVQFNSYNNNVGTWEGLRVTSTGSLLQQTTVPRATIATLEA